MRKLRKAELAILVGSAIGVAIVAADELPEIVVTASVGYVNMVLDVPVPFTEDYTLGPPPSTTVPPGEFSASPTVHTKCVNATLAEQLDVNVGNNPYDFPPIPSQSTNTALPLPVRYANPIDIAYTATIGSAFGATKASNGFAIFPNVQAGTNAAIYSANNYAAANYNITDLVNAWAPAASNPNAMSNFLSALGITAANANDTYLRDLTAEQILQVIAAFAWTEGFNRSSSPSTPC